MTLLEKVKREKLRRDIRFTNELEGAIGISRTLTDQILKGKTSLNEAPKKKLMEFCSEITEADFTPVSAGKKVENRNKLSPRLAEMANRPIERSFPSSVKEFCEVNYKY